MKASTPDKTHRFQPQPSFPPDPGSMLVETGLDATRSATTFTVNAGGTPADSQVTLLTELLMVGPPAKIEETLAAKLRPSPYSSIDIPDLLADHTVSKARAVVPLAPSVSLGEVERCPLSS